MNGSKAAVGAAEGIKAPHNVIMEDRHTLTVSGISDVDSFDEQPYSDSKPTQEGGFWSRVFR